jgi:hypothetical protein
VDLSFVVVATALNAKNVWFASAKIKSNECVTLSVAKLELGAFVF